MPFLRKSREKAYYRTNRQHFGVQLEYSSVPVSCHLKDSNVRECPHEDQRRDPF